MGNWSHSAKQTSISHPARVAQRSSWFFPHEERRPQFCVVASAMDKDIEHVTKTCTSCQQNKNAPTPASLHPWTWPEKPWQHIHIDFAGPFMGTSFLVIVDSHSKWPEVFEMSTTTTTKTITKLRDLFARFGIPEQVVSDNGPQFTSEKFTSFMKSNGIKHTHCAPYHPSSNGAVERFNQTFKQSLRASEKDGRTLSPTC